MNGIHGITEHITHARSICGISPTEQNEFVFNESAKFVNVIARTFHPAAFIEHIF
jgi:hypothetical protein